MSAGIHNIRSKGSCSNAYEFEWDSQTETKLYIIVSYVVCIFDCLFKRNYITPPSISLYTYIVDIV